MRRLTNIGILLALLPLAGCLSVDTALTLREDGSGDIDVTYTLSDQDIAQLRALFALQDQMLEISGQPAEQTASDRLMRMLLDPNEDVLRKKFLEYRPHGVDLDLILVESRSARQRVRLRFQFKSLTGLAKTDLFRVYGFTLAKTTKGNYYLFRDGIAPAPDDGLNLNSPETVNLLTPLLTGFHVIVRINTPERIISANAFKKSPFSATWNYEFDQDPKALSTLMTESIKLIFDGRTLNLPTVSYKEPG